MSKKHEWFDRGVLDDIIENTRRYYPNSNVTDTILYRLDEQLASLTTNPAIVFVMHAPDYDEFIKNRNDTINSAKTDKAATFDVNLKIVGFTAKKSAGRWMFQER
jgi:hypothetical protein